MTTDRDPTEKVTLPPMTREEVAALAELAIIEAGNERSDVLFDQLAAKLRSALQREGGDRRGSTDEMKRALAVEGYLDEARTPRSLPDFSPQREDCGHPNHGNRDHSCAPFQQQEEGGSGVGTATIEELRDELRRLVSAAAECDREATGDAESTVEMEVAAEASAHVLRSAARRLQGILERAATPPPTLSEQPTRWGRYDGITVREERGFLDATASEVEPDRPAIGPGDGD